MQDRMTDGTDDETFDVSLSEHAPWSDVEAGLLREAAPGPVLQETAGGDRVARASRQLKASQISRDILTSLGTALQPALTDDRRVQVLEQCLERTLAKVRVLELLDE
jgi:hypothetical protein